MPAICPKCDYERHPTDTAPDYECPQYGVVYAKAKVAIQKAAQKAEEKKQFAQQLAKERKEFFADVTSGGQANEIATGFCPQCGEEVLTTAKRCKGCAAFITGKVKAKMPKIKARTSGIPFADADTPAPSFQRCTACAEEFPSTHSHCPHCAQPAPATIEADSEMNLHKALISLFVSVITFGFLYLYWFAYIPEKPYEYCIQRADWGKFHEGCTRFSELAEVAIKRKRERAEEKRKSDEEYTRNFKRRVEAQTLMDKAERVWGKGNF